MTLTQRVEHDENFVLKIVGEIGDLAKLLKQEREERKKLELRIKKLEGK